MKVLEYKFLFEERKKSKLELKEGTSDLNFRLSFFLSANVSKHNTIIQKNINTAADHIVNHNKSKDKDELIEKDFNHPKVIKKLQRKIVTHTHPDKVDNLPEDVLEKYKEYYQLAIKSLEEKRYSDIIMIADSLLITVEANLISDYIDPEIPRLKEEINFIKSQLGYKWYHVNETKKDESFKEILKSLGFKYTDKEVEKAINQRRPKRKTGERPKSLKERRRINAKYKNNSNS